MAGARNDFTYKGYGCPHTEMWSRRAAFEEARPDLNHFMKMDAPHYASSKTRIAYAEWEAENPCASETA
jgi:hypothetical protein